MKVYNPVPLRLALLFAFALSAAAQFNASLQGTITDSSGGVVPNAHVTLTNKVTGATLEATADNQGSYRYNQLAAGKYDLKVEAGGFQAAAVTDIQIAADLPQNANVTLSPGTVQSTTTVSASVLPTLQTSAASISGTVTSESIEQ